MAEYRETERLKREARQAKEIGTKAHRRFKEAEWTQDQNEAADTCIVEVYPKGNGVLRVERRKPGYAWAGGKRQSRKELVGHAAYKDEHGQEHEDTRALVESGKGLRGKCRGAVPTVMARMRDKMNKVNRECIPVFITLGWPKANTPDAEEAKRCLKVFLQKLERKFPRAAGFWKLEFGDDSGLPHFHILLWGATPWKGWLSRVWFEICRTDNPNHLAAGTRIERIRSYRGVLSYSGKKYMGKTGTAPAGNWGRVWGTFNQAKIPWETPIRVEAPGRVGMWFARIQRRFMRAKYGRKNGGRGRVLWVNCEHASQWLRVLEWAETLPTPSAIRLAECPF